MKRIFALLPLIALLISCSRTVNEKDIPDNAKSVVTAQHPEAKNIKWEKGSTGYEAVFRQNGSEITVVFDAGGKFIETETEININALASAINDYVSKNFAGKKIKEAVKITDAAGVVKYEIEVDGDDYLFDAAGNFIQKENEDGDDGEDPDDNDD